MAILSGEDLDTVSPSRFFGSRSSAWSFLLLFRWIFEKFGRVGSPSGRGSERRGVAWVWISFAVLSTVVWMSSVPDSVLRFLFWRFRPVKVEKDRCEGKGSGEKIGFLGLLEVFGFGCYGKIHSFGMFAWFLWHFNRYWLFPLLFAAVILEMKRKRLGGSRWDFFVGFEKFGKWTL